MNKNKVCFFAGVEDRSLLKLMQWYKNDIRILKDLGFEVSIATKWKEIPWDSDLYFAWWPTKGILPLIKAKLRSKPIIIVAGGSEVVHSYNLKYNFNNSSVFKKTAIKISLRYADRVLAISESAKKEILGLSPNCRVKTVYLSVNSDIFRPLANEKKDIIFTISHLNKENIYRKRIKEIIEAIPYIAREFPQVKFVIAGRKLGGFDELKRRVKDLSIERNVEFPGKISNEKKLSYFRRSLVYLQPTLHEGFGLAMAEAMSCGLPVVTSKVAAVPEVVGDAGVYVDPNDPQKIAEAVKELLSNPEKREKLGKLARERIIKKFSYEIRKKKISTIIREVLKNETDI